MKRKGQNRSNIISVVAVLLGVVGSFFWSQGATAYYPNELITNGGFETGDTSGWVPNLTSDVTSIYKFDGAYSAYLGVYSQLDPLVQTIQIPVNATSATFSGWYSVYTYETQSYSDYVRFGVMDDASHVIYCNYNFDPADLPLFTSWTFFSCDLSYAHGKTVDIFLFVNNDSSLLTSAYFDDISVEATLADTTPPTTSHSISPTVPNSGYFTTTPTITLTATDDLGGSGIASTSYSWDNGISTAYSGPFTAPKGTHTLTYKSRDNAGNVEVPRIIVIRNGDDRPLAIRLAELNRGIIVNTALTTRLKGRILLQVQQNGEAWYINPVDGRRYSLGRPADAFSIMRKLGLGITNANLAKIPRAGTNDVGDATIVNRLKGRIVLQVESKGEAWYISPVNGKRYSMGRPDDAFSLMRSLGLGIANVDLQKIYIGLSE